MNHIGEQLIKDLKLESLSPDEQTAIIEKFSDTLFQAILVRGLESLTEAQKDALDVWLKERPDGGPDALMDFFIANVPNFQTVVDDETKRIRDRIMSVVGNS